MRRFGILIIALTAIVGVLGSTVLARATPVTNPIPCRETTAAEESYRLYVLSVTMAQDSLNAKRRAVFELPFITDSSAVSYVTDTTVCTQAASAHALAVSDTGTPRDVHVLRVGPAHYIVFNYTAVGHWNVRRVFDASFNLLTSILE